MANIDENTKIIDGIVIGSVKVPGHSVEEEFEICSIDAWKKLTQEQAEKEAKNAFYENGYAEIGFDVEDLDWWY